MGTGRGIQEELWHTRTHPWQMAKARAGGRAFDPIEMLESAADLMNPFVGAKQMPWLAGELVKIPLGRSGVAFEEGDRRFADVTWQENLFFRLLGRPSVDAKRSTVRGQLLHVDDS